LSIRPQEGARWRARAQGRSSWSWSSFGQSRITIVSQRFHHECSLYSAQSYRLDAIAFNAEDIRLKWALRPYIREAFARVKAVLDFHVLGAIPKFLGPKVSLDEPPQDAQTK